MPSTTLPRHLRITLDELREEAARRFGPDPAAVAYLCPSCGDIATVQEWHDATGDPDTAAAGRECIGRVVEGRGCQYTVYGPPRGGTWSVDTPGGLVMSFPLAPAVVRGVDL